MSEESFMNRLSKGIWLIIICTVFICSYSSYSQRLSAQLLDFNEQPIEGVKVFYDQTTISTFTDKDGVFELPINTFTPESKIICYHPDFEIFEISDSGNLRPEHYLKQKNEESKISYSEPDFFSEEEMYQVFREYFLGRSSNTKTTKILNKEILQFQFDTLSHTLTAKASKPLQIQNDALGYHIEYYLKDFELEFSVFTIQDDYLDSSFYFGYSLFKDMDSTKTKEREEAYDGTISYFFKQIVNEEYNNVKSKVIVDDKKIRLKKVFNVEKTEDDNYKLSLTNKVFSNRDDGDFTFYIRPHRSEQGKREFYYNMKGDTYYRNQASKVTLFRPYLMVDKYGNALEREYFEISGPILDVNISDMLPKEYNLINRK